MTDLAGRLGQALKEPSTWSALAAFCGLVAASFPPTAYYAGGVGAICAGLGVWIKEHGSP